MTGDFMPMLQLAQSIGIQAGGMLRILFLHLRDELPVHLIRHRAAGDGLGEDHSLFGGEYLAGFRHEAHAAHQDGLVLDLRRVDAELEAVAREVRDLADLVSLIAVGEDANVLFIL